MPIKRRCGTVRITVNGVERLVTGGLTVNGVTHESMDPSPWVGDVFRVRPRPTLFGRPPTAWPSFDASDCPWLPRCTESLDAAMATRAIRAACADDVERWTKRGWYDRATTPVERAHTYRL